MESKPPTLIEFPCMTGRQPLYLKPGPGPVEILDVNGATILRLDLKAERGVYELDVGTGIEIGFLDG